MLQSPGELFFEVGDVDDMLAGALPISFLDI